MRNTSPLPIAMTLAAAATLMLALSPQAQPENPASLPVGHPAVDTPNPTESMTPAAPEDVATIEAIVEAYYDSISGPQGEPRDWDRMISLFMPDARFIAARMVEGRMIPYPMSPQKFVETNSTYFEKSGYSEKEIHHEIDRFGAIAQVFSTYSSSKFFNDAETVSRGINALHLMNIGDRWWITTIMWDYEKPGIDTIPAMYLPSEELGG